MILKKIIAIACSTGGPKALQQVVPYLDERIGCPVVIVQHMPDGFTKALADRLNANSKLPVCESENNQILKNNNIYIAKAGFHLKIEKIRNEHRIIHTDEDTRLGVKPCADYMYESLATSGYDEIICVVLTGMGSDGSDGIEYLKQSKKIKLIVQDKDSCVVFGMPGSVLKRNKDCITCKLSDIGNEIIKNAEG
ncbi:MAG: chemotaxis protein CheB [Lachnospiraceae bacterium]|nr:chemotaxis protein CheB [Lachnospiraceae bacterium]